MALTIEQARKVCAVVASGKTLTKACEQTGYSRAEFYRLRDMDAVLREEYAQAREQWLEGMEDDILEISDNKELEPHDKRIRIEARQKHLAANKAAKWGAKLALQVTEVDYRQAQREGTERVLRLGRDMATTLIAQPVDVTAQQLKRLADKSSALLVVNPSDDDIFA